MDILIPYIVASATFGCLTSYLAYRRGKDPTLWFVIGIFFGVLGIVYLYLLPFISKEDSDEEKLDNTAAAVAVTGVSNGRKDLLELAGEKKNSDGKEVPELGDYCLHEWHYLDADHDQHGPVDFDYLKLCYREHKISPSTYVWTEGMENWLTIQEMAPLKNSLEDSEEE